MQYIKDRTFTEYIKDAIFILEYYCYNNIDDDPDDVCLKHFMKFEFLKTKAIKTIDNFGGVLYRGIDIGIDISKQKILEPKYVITSWTTDYNVAKTFASEYKYKGKNGFVLIEHDLSNVIFYMDHFIEFVKTNLYKYLDSEYQIIVDEYYSEYEVICKSKPFRLINGVSRTNDTYVVSENLEYKDMVMFYHQTDSDIEKIKKEGFNSSEVWASPDDTASYSDNVLIIYASVKNPFVMDKYVAKDYDIDINTIEKNIKYYNDIGGEANPKTFDTLRKLGYDAIIETNGDRCFLYPDRIRF